jgi:hypothetical protein
VQPQPPLLPVLLALQHAVPHQHPVGLPVLDALKQLWVGVWVHKLVAQRLNSPDLEPQVPQLGFVAEDVVFEVADFLFQVEDAGRGGLGAVDEDGVEVLGGLDCAWDGEGVRWAYIGLFFSGSQLFDEREQFAVELFGFVCYLLGHVGLRLSGLLGCFKGLVGRCC